MKNLTTKPALSGRILTLSVAILCLINSNLFAASITQANTGNWNAAATWAGGVVPTSADDVTLLGNKICTINIANAECLSITVVNNVSGAPCSLKFNAGSQLTVGNVVTLGNGGSRNGNIDMSSGGTLICNSLAANKGTGNIVFTAGLGTVILNNTNTIPSVAFTTFYNLTLNNGTTTAPASLNITGTLVTNASFNHNSGTITFNGTTLQTIGGTVRPTLNNVTINNTLNEVELSSSISINGALNFTGGKLNIKDFDLTMIGASTITNVTSSKYVKTSGTGMLKRSVGGSAVLFPVGNTAYNPVEITNAGTSDFYGVYVIDNVTDDGSGVGTTTTFPVVNRTWMLEEDVPGGSMVTMSLQWSTADELNSFDKVAAFMTHYESTPGMWDNIGGSVSGADPYLVQSSGITSFSPFSISSGGGFAPLPTELVSFQAIASKDRKVDVSWTTASEHNSSHFTIHHSVDGLNWKAISTVSAANNSTEIINYSIVDENPEIGLNYYRLTQFDTDGKYKQYDPVSVKTSLMTENSIVVYPNPGNEMLKVELMNSNLKGEVVVEIFDASGALIESRNTFVQSGYNNLIVEDFIANNGVYFLQIRNGDYTTDKVMYIKQ